MGDKNKKRRDGCDRKYDKDLLRFVRDRVPVILLLQEVTDLERKEGVRVVQEMIEILPIQVYNGTIAPVGVDRVGLTR